MIRLLAPIAVALLSVSAIHAQAKDEISGKTKAQWLQQAKSDASARGRAEALAVLSTWPQEKRDLAIIEGVVDALLGDKSERVRLIAVDAIVAMALTSTEKDRNPIVDAVGKALTSDISEAVRLKLATMAKDFRKDFELRRLSPMLIESLKNEKSVPVKVAIATALGKTGEHVKTLLKGMIEGLKDADPAVRAAVADSFGRIGFEAAEAVPALKPLLVDKDPSVRLAAAFSLGRIGPDAASAVPELSAALASDADVAVRKESARAFTFLGLDAKSAVPALAKALREDKAEEVRQQCALALGKMRGETTAVAPAMVEAMKKDSDKIVRVFITHALADSLGDGLRTYVKDMAEQLDKDQEGDVRMALVQELGALGPAAKDALPAIQKSVTDVQQPVREEAKKALKKVLAKQ